ncbi:MAG: energy-coupling factor transporter ATPase, partial [bacterium]
SEAKDLINAPDSAAPANPVIPSEAKDLMQDTAPSFSPQDFAKPVQLELENVTYSYSKGTAYETKALDAVSLKIRKGQFIGVIGHTGSGKSTLIQHLNGLMRPTEGRVLFEGKDIWEKGYDLRKLRTRVGMVFQLPESQLFENDVLTDCAFGPKNQGFSVEEAKEKAKAALHIAGIGEEYYNASPFELSGGQKRRVAIAGVLAMEPEILILDEPTAGLDPKGRDEILERIRDFHNSHGITILLVSHSMEDVAAYADRLIVVHEGKIAFDDTPTNVFAQYRKLETMGLAAPQITYLMNELAEDGYNVDVRADTVEEAAADIYKRYRKKTQRDGSSVF